MFIFFTFLSVVSAMKPADVFAVNAYWFTDPVKAPYTYMASTIIVPPIPSKQWQTLFIWPGLQPLGGGANYFPIDNGVLQPVLTWGYSCAPNPNSISHEGWWISAQYVNTVGNALGYRGCYGGERMRVYPGDALRMVMELINGTTIWKQTVTSQTTGKSVRFLKDMRGQAQAWAEFVMEVPGGWYRDVPSWNVTNIVLRTNGSSRTPGFCNYANRVQQLPGASLNCTKPRKRTNMCRITSCTFNLPKF